MSSHQVNDSDFAGLVLGALAATLVGGVIGVVLWSFLSDWSSWGSIFGGLIIGGGVGTVVGIATGWNGSSIQVGDSKTDATPLWGVVPSVMIGIGVGPIVGGSLAMICCLGEYNIADYGNGLLMGVIIGPIVGVLSWQLAYFGQAFVTGAASEVH
jgi:hypothetical protein